MLSLILAGSANVQSAPYALIFIIISLVLLGITAFLSIRGEVYPWRHSLGWAGIFFFVLAVAFGA